MSKPNGRIVIGCERLSGCMLWAIPISIILQNSVIYFMNIVAKRGEKCCGLPGGRVEGVAK
jgi:hypothetical protein